MADDELRIPTLSLPATVLFADGSTLDGEVFLPAASPSHAGPTTAMEHLNEDEAFLAFHPKGAEAPVLLNKAEVLAMSFAAAERSDEQEAIFLHRAVVLECGAQRLEGLLSIDEMQGQRRILDYLNRAPRFLPLRDGESDRLVNRDRITRVIEVRGA